MEFEVELTEEAAEFILSLPIKMQAKIQRTMNLLKEFGYLLSEPHAKKIRTVTGLHELRIQFGSDICRFFYFHFKEKTYIITSGYVKKEMKTNPREIEKTVRIMNELMENK